MHKHNNNPINSDKSDTALAHIIDILNRLSQGNSDLLQVCGMSDSLTLESLRKKYEEMEKEQLLSTYTFPTSPSSDGYYHIYVADPEKKSGRKPIKAKDLDNLRDKVYQHEKGISGRARKTFKDVFEIVQQEKVKYVKDPEKLISIKNSISVRKSNYKRFFEGSTLEQKYIE